MSILIIHSQDHTLVYIHNIHNFQIQKHIRFFFGFENIENQNTLPKLTLDFHPHPVYIYYFLTNQPNTIR